jgi:transcriptional antiterminator Rof (Rho-off)
MTSDYRPIDCDQHSLLELLAMRRAAVTARSTDENGAQSLIEGVVSDVITRGGAEYLVLRGVDREATSIRLDRLQAVYDAAGLEVWRQKIA